MAKDKRTYTNKKDHGHDMSYENETKYDNVNAPQHYLHGKKETIDVISDCMTYHDHDLFYVYMCVYLLPYSLLIVLISINSIL